MRTCLKNKAKQNKKCQEKEERNELSSNEKTQKILKCVLLSEKPYTV
jgi:hypothetical protein